MDTTLGTEAFGKGETPVTLNSGGLYRKEGQVLEGVLEPNGFLRYWMGHSQKCLLLAYSNIGNVGTQRKPGKPESGLGMLNHRSRDPVGILRMNSRPPHLDGSIL